MKAVILAAGLGKRLGGVGRDLPKCMLEINGETLIGRLLRQISTYRIDEICIVVGHCADILKKHIMQLPLKLPPITFIHNDKYAYANNIYSLYVAREYLNDAIFLFEADLILEDSILWRLFTSTKENFALVAKYQTWMDGSVMQLRGEIVQSLILGEAFNFKDKDSYYKTINVYRFSQEFLQNIYFPLLESYVKADKIVCYYETALAELICKGYVLEAEVLEQWQKWYEIDNISDLRVARTLFAENQTKYQLLQNAYGGYWRFGLKDYYYLVNPYFPSENLLQEMQFMSDKLLTSYPSSLEINKELVANIVGVDSEFLVVGNGAGELIAILMKNLSGNLGVICPTFLEYENRYNGVVKHFLTNGFVYKSQEIITFLEKEKIKILTLITPDNPSGFLPNKYDILEILDYANANGIYVVLDISFMDFAPMPYDFLDSLFLLKYHNLIIIKSLGKSYGVAGLRLGILATSNKEMLNKISKEIPIWNINSFGEYFLQSMQKYKKDYKKACENLKIARQNMKNHLKAFKQFKIYDSSSNYFLIEVLDSTSLESLILYCLECEFFLKDCSKKLGSSGKFMRLAILKDEQNMQLISVFKDFFKKE
ncbi:MAG: aminotransferase class I/II-fold pyridoxal phosphate-dependent enzyme [Helicobacter sp.]|nr:aminotransferase class I/II-fold pyridoxal phosphate-dependent enzyme [Helicobacter sp.]